MASRFQELLDRAARAGVRGIVFRVQLGATYDQNDPIDRWTCEVAEPPHPPTHRSGEEALRDVVLALETP